jgi:hypothetical protein
MKTKLNAQQKVCSYILEQLQKKYNCRLTSAERAAFTTFWEEQNYQLTAHKLNLPPKQIFKLLDKAFAKLKVREAKPVFKSEEDFLLAPIFIHPFSTRLYHVLRFMDCNNLGELLTYSKKDLMRQRGFGKKAYEEIKKYINNNGWYPGGLLK